MIETTLQTANSKTINEILIEHHIHSRYTDNNEAAITKLRAHQCDWQCLVRVADAGEEVEGEENVVDVTRSTLFNSLTYMSMC